MTGYLWLLQHIQVFLPPRATFTLCQGPLNSLRILDAACVTIFQSCSFTTTSASLASPQDAEIRGCTMGMGENEYHDQHRADTFFRHLVIFEPRALKIRGGCEPAVSPK